MTQCEAVEIQNPKEDRLPRFDWILLPLTGLVTVASILGLAEIGARIVFPEDKQDVCLVQDSSIRARFQPNYRSRTKLAEGNWVENAYNECGYPSQESCGTKPAGSIRIAVLGSSASFGYALRYDDGYTSLASKALSRQCGREVEFQNLGVPSNSLIDFYHRTSEALALKPDISYCSLSIRST